MQKLTRQELLSLEDYAERRNEFRGVVMAHKKERRVEIGPHATLYFEDRTTMLYQVQEMLRVERISESDAIDEELSTYNPLIPDGSNWKATFMIEFEDEAERKTALESMKGIESRVWVKVAGHEHVWAIADEDMERENSEKTSSVHFLRFELSPEMVASAKADQPIAVGIEHEAYCHQSDPVPETIRASLSQDLA
ncbi:MAG TPA: DUF3501 family protein [Acidiferrobacteraceae bacterium]|nr:DUF3501 family protein [Acidiferrobacteraceae bacterium]